MRHLGLRDEDSEPVSLASVSSFEDPSGSSHVAVDFIGVHELQRTPTLQGRASLPDVMPPLEILPKHGNFHSSTSINGKDYIFMKHLEDIFKR